MKKAEELKNDAIEFALHTIESQIKHAIVRGHNSVTVSSEWLGLPLVIASLAGAGYTIVESTILPDTHLISW